MVQARFHSAAKEKGVLAHIGAEVSVTDLRQRTQSPFWLPPLQGSQPVRLPLLCTSQIGYQNLSQLITRFKMRMPEKGEGAAMLNDLTEFRKGLICLTGGDEGPLAAALSDGGAIAGQKMC